MNPLSIAENIIRLRREKGITQDELAAFLGITKASVSKWETKQSYPDIMLIPQIATFFNITTDELLGYNPQLSQQQIQKYYVDLSTDFTRLPFDTVIDKCEKLTKEYYACYPFLSQIALLYLNHYMLSEDAKKQADILEKCIMLCNRVESDCSQIPLKEEACIIRAIAHLQLNRPQEAIDILTPFIDPKQIRMTVEGPLVQAYHVLGENEKADYYCQFHVYAHLIHLIAGSISLLALHMDQPDYCKETIRRTEQMIAAYQLDLLHPGVCSEFYYQAAIFYVAYAAKDNTLSYLKQFVSSVVTLLENDITLHGDEYFTRIDEWVSSPETDAHAPRDKETIAKSAVQAFENPAFSALFEDTEYKKLKSELERRLSI